MKTSRSHFREKKFLKKNALVWGILYVLFILVFGLSNEGYNGYFDVTISFVISALIFYLNFFLCERFFVKKRIFYFLFLLVLLVLYNGFFYLFVLTENVLQRGKLTYSTLFYFSLYFVMVVLISCIYWSVLYAGEKQKESLRMQLALQQMENEKTIAEKRFLLSQVNPHFLYNTLNFFYAKSLGTSPELAESILLLSGILRHSLEQKEDRRGMTLLENEVEHINNIIKINQYRFSNKLQIRFMISGNILQVRLVPFVLFTFIENALKHGDMSDEFNPITISLAVDEKEQKIFFSVHNKKNKGPLEQSTGIGIDNARKRLDFIYGENYRLTLKNETDFYSVNLILPLFKDMPE